MRSHKIWVDATGGSAKGFGCGSDSSITLDVAVGSGPKNSRKITRIVLAVYEGSNELDFTVKIDGQVYRRETFDTKKKEFKGIEGFPIDGSTEKQEERQREAENGLLKMAGMFGAMADVLANTPEEATQLKKRALLSVPGISMPDDFDSLPEEEKQRRLDGAIGFALDQKK